MLDMGFKPAIRRIVAAIPAVHQTLCYSATLEGAVREVAGDYLKNPVRVEIGSVLKPAENVKLQTFEVTADRKLPLLEHLLRSEAGSFMVSFAPSMARNAWPRNLPMPVGKQPAFMATVASPSATPRYAASPRVVIECWSPRMSLPAAST